MFGNSSLWSRRSVIKTGGTAGLAAAAGMPLTASPQSKQPARSDARPAIEQRVESTPIIDTHEHLIEEEARLKGTSRRIRANDWSCLLSHYLDSDLTTCGMPRKTQDAFFGLETDPLQKWSLLEPYWPRVRHTGYGQAVEIAMKRLYGIDRLSGVRRTKEGGSATCVVREDMLSTLAVRAAGTLGRGGNSLLAQPGWQPPQARFPWIAVRQRAEQLSRQSPGSP